MRYNRLTDLGLTEAQIRDNLMFATDKIGETMTVAMRPADAKAWFDVVPPDLTVEARVRGADVALQLLPRASTRTTTTPSGWNNLVFPNVAMPHVLAELGGTNRLVDRGVQGPREGAGRGARRRSASSSSRPARTTRTSSGRSSQDTPGTLEPGRVPAHGRRSRQFPRLHGRARASNQRTRLGLVVLLYLGVLFVFAYWMKREYWKDVH